MGTEQQHPHQQRQLSLRLHHTDDTSRSDLDKGLRDSIWHQCDLGGYGVLRQHEGIEAIAPRPAGCDDIRVSVKQVTLGLVRRR